MFNEVFIAEIVIWVLVCTIASKTKNGYLFRLCDFFLLFIVTGHSLKITIPAFLTLTTFFLIWKHIGDFLKEVIFPEAKSVIHEKIRKGIG